MNGRGIMVVLIAAAGIAGAYWFFFIRPAVSEGEEIIPGVKVGGAQIDFTAIPASFPLSKGSKGKEVAQLQRFLKVADDGIWGSKTQAAFESARLFEAPNIIPEVKQMTKTLYLQYGISKY